ncbi:cbb3-type cytochrome c oxidase N-terminal domain-containing protein [Cytophagaceae bacterium ABcell3]|nr:cbb3-type cytochrome c oxidase N-terminal domain-containing protein [Cytophagaceae bacterium ABcell3]
MNFKLLTMKKQWFIPAMLLAALNLLPVSAFAAEDKGLLQSLLSNQDAFLSVLLILIIFVVLVLLFVLVAFRALINFLQAENKFASSNAVEPQQSWWAALQDKLTDAVPVEREHEVLTSHEYDGIRELDNNLPPWWKFMFYATIVFSVVYLGYYHYYDGPSSAEEYYAEMKIAEARIAEHREKAGNLIDENNVEVLDDVSHLASGEAIYSQNCAACHGVAGEGGVGPNLADEYWLYGGDIKDIFKSIKYGIPQKGMIAWQGQLTPLQIQEVSSFIYHMHGTNPPNAKEPQGEIHKR